MKIQVNLYQPSCHPKREKATFAQFLALCAICLFVAVSSYLLVAQQTKSDNEKLISHQASITEQQLMLSNLVAELQKNRAPDGKLRLHSRLEKEVKAKQRMLSTLTNIDIKELVSFSALMRGLSHADMADLSINHFSMVAGVLNVEGAAKQSDSVPLWLSNIQATKELSTVAFKAISITEQQGVFSFQLTNSDLRGSSSE